MYILTQEIDRFAYGLFTVAKTFDSLQLLWLALIPHALLGGIDSPCRLGRLLSGLLGIL